LWTSNCISPRKEWSDLRHHPPESKKPSNNYTMPEKGAWGSTTNLDRYMIKSKQETTKAIGDGDTVVTSLWEAISNLAGAVVCVY